jgi:hypothetical protein
MLKLNMERSSMNNTCLFIQPFKVWSYYLLFSKIGLTCSSVMILLKSSS